MAAGALFKVAASAGIIMFLLQVFVGGSALGAIGLAGNSWVIFFLLLVVIIWFLTKK